MNERRTSAERSGASPKGPNKGFVLLLTLIFMAILTISTGALLYMTTYEMRNIGPQTDDLNLSGLADAGIDKAHRAVRDDYLTTTSTGVADLRGADTSLSVSLGSPDNMRHIDASVAAINADTDQAILRTFDSNYTNTRIISVEIHVRASRAGPPDASATIQIAYTTDGSAYTIVITQALTTTMTDYSATVAALASWSTMMSSNFRLRAMRIAGDRNINIDAMYLRVNYGIDTPKESWATGGYATFPISLSGGTIESITITDEEKKVHLNYASEDLLSNLLTNVGIGGASTKAANIVSYRGAGLTNPFDTVEELQQVPGITVSDYSTLKNYVTAYSFINTNVYRPTGPRASININTAPFEVLKAIFDPLTLEAGDSTSLANDIITFRGSTPFTCFYSSDAAITTDFYDFVNGRSYLTATEQNIVLDNCDASSLIPVSGDAGFNCLTTEFCYASSVFYIEALAQVGSRKLRVKTLRGNDGSRSFATYIGDPTISGWRKENYE